MFQLKIKTRKIALSLQNKGFEAEETHHTYFWFYHNDQRTHIKTKISHGSNEYGDNLLSAMQKQLKLNSKKELLDLINCPMSQEDYIRLLTNKNEI